MTATERGGNELPGRLLITEDEESIRHLLSKCFELSAEVCAVASAEAALEALCTFKPEFIITDLSLPGMDGLALIKAIRNTHRGAVLPIMVLTANG